MNVWVNAGPVESVFLPLTLPVSGLAPVTLITDENQEFLQGETEETEALPLKYGGIRKFGHP